MCAVRCASDENYPDTSDHIQCFCKCKNVRKQFYRQAVHTTKVLFFQRLHSRTPIGGLDAKSFTSCHPHKQHMKKSKLTMSIHFWSPQFIVSYRITLRGSEETKYDLSTTSAVVAGHAHAGLSVT